MRNVQENVEGVYIVTVSNASGQASSDGMGLNLPEARVLGARFDNGVFVVEVQSHLGKRYRLESKDSLNPGALWVRHEEVPGVAGSLELRDDRALESGRYYRVVRR